MAHTTTSRRAANVTSAPPPTPTLVQAVGVEQSGGGAINLPYGSDVTAGNVLVAAYAALGLDGVTNTVTITDSLSNTWALAGATTVAANTYGMAIYWTRTTNGGADTVTATPSAFGGGLGRLGVHELAHVTALDQTAGAIGPAYPLDSGPITTTHAVEMLFGWGASPSGISTPGPGFTIAADVGGEATEYQAVASAGTYHVTFPGDGASSGWVITAATFA